MATQSVTVLTPHARRQIVKVTPNMTILEVIILISYITMLIQKTLKNIYL